MTRPAGPWGQEWAKRHALPSVGPCGAPLHDCPAQAGHTRGQHDGQQGPGAHPGAKGGQQLEVATAYAFP